MSTIVIWKRLLIALHEDLQNIIDGKSTQYELPFITSGQRMDIWTGNGELIMTR